MLLMTTQDGRSRSSLYKPSYRAAGREVRPFDDPIAPGGFGYISPNPVTSGFGPPSRDAYGEYGPGSSSTTPRKPPGYPQQNSYFEPRGQYQDPPQGGRYYPESPALNDRMAPTYVAVISYKGQ